MRLHGLFSICPRVRSVRVGAESGALRRGRSPPGRDGQQEPVQGLALGRFGQLPMQQKFSLISLLV